MNKLNVAPIGVYSSSYNISHIKMNRCENLLPSRYFTGHLDCAEGTNFMADHLKQWIAPLLDSCTRIIAKEARKERIKLSDIAGCYPGEGSFVSEINSPDDEESSDIPPLPEECDEKRHRNKYEPANKELDLIKPAVYFKMISEIQKSTQLQVMIENSDRKGFCREFSYRFFKDFKEIRRGLKKVDDDPLTASWRSEWHSYYRHIQQVLHNDPDTKDKVFDKDISCYTYSDGDPPMMPYCYDNEEMLQCKTWGMVEVPRVKRGEKSPLGKKVHMLRIARFYYDEVEKAIRIPCYIPVKGVVNYIFDYYPDHFSQGREQLALATDEEGEIIPFKLPPVPLVVDNSTLNREETCVAARDCAGRMSDNEKVAFLMESRGYPLKTIAEELGYSSPASAKNSLDSAKEHFRRHWAIWGTERDTDSDLLTVYFDAVLEYCAEECRITTSEDLIVQHSEEL